MSADNVIYISKENNWYHVWHDCASNDDPIPDGWSYKKFKTKLGAINYAQKLEKEVGYVEYGVCIND